MRRMWEQAKLVRLQLIASEMVGTRPEMCSGHTHTVPRQFD